MLHVVVTGAGRGLGATLAAHFAGAGMNVLAATRGGSACGSRIHPPLDVGDEVSIEAFAASVDQPVDILVNNAAIDARSLGADGDRGVLEISPEHFLEQSRINAVGPMLLTRALLPRLEEADSARVVNITSQLGSMSYGAEHGGDIGYNASKAALNAVTVRTASVLRPRGITVVALHPGWVRTDMGGRSAPLGADESAAAIVDTVSHLTMNDTGRFLRWDGTDHPW
jgi:NAD(P)-dependent dehydrogenase (short-subunit alcohol dehydrogenase family)